jgi:hypothetical protein
MKMLRYVLLGLPAGVLILIGFLPGCAYLRMLGAALLGKGNVG